MSDFLSSTSVMYLKGVGERLAKQLDTSLGIRT